MSNRLMNVVRASGAWLVLVVLGVASACSSSNMLDERYVSDRPEFSSRALPNPEPETSPPPPPHLEVINPAPAPVGQPEVEEVGRGIWTFTTPPTVTRIEHKAADFSQFSLYDGRPAPADVPIVVITVSADRRSLAAADPQTYTVTSARNYVLNGNIAHELHGTTDTGEAFTELLLSRPGDATGDVCHAMATPHTPEQRKLALEILSSITWKVNDADK